MYNYVMLVGRIATEVEIRETNDGKKVLNLVLAVNRPFKNFEGSYETDFIRIALWEQVAEIANEYVKKGTTVCVKGRLTTRKETLQNGVIVNLIEVIGDKIIFLSPKDCA